MPVLIIFALVLAIVVLILIAAFPTTNPVNQKVVNLLIVIDIILLIIGYSHLIPT
jgi:hypothetical protein